MEGSISPLFLITVFWAFSLPSHHVGGKQTHNSKTQTTDRNHSLNSCHQPERFSILQSWLSPYFTHSLPILSLVITNKGNTSLFQFHASFTLTTTSYMFSSFLQTFEPSVNVNEKVNWGKLKLPEIEMIWEWQRNCIKKLLLWQATGKVTECWRWIVFMVKECKEGEVQPERKQ